MDLRFYKEIAGRYHREFKLFRDSFFPIVMKWEGGGKLHNVKGDSGGWTVWGVAYNYNKRLFTDFNDFKDTTQEEASYIAFVKYYLAAKAELMPREAKLYYFDMAYNMGTNRAIKIMQKCAGVKQDGIIGVITESKMQNVTECCLMMERNSFYNRLAEKAYRYKKFLKGWLNRSKSIYDFQY
ncbi:glycosyl hydrolase 108 family protein [Lacinutrix sp. Hel_I_90]|uniref:glycosyl hydrolase 108 family protein n=1 Tax=Lacinutrix sp. Hel_I_90 TaxID=1249999 RepID=UPI000695B92B|nr:glycosyl hydrolase 108 family protein [Lacinutrix sp. Hel_I_90]